MNNIKKIRGFFKKSLKRIWLLSYIVIFLLPLTSSLIISYHSRQVVLKQSKELVNEVVLRNQDNLKTCLVDCERIYKLLYFNQNVERFSLLDNPEEASQITARAIINDIKNVLMDTPSVADVQIVFNNIQMVASANRFESVEDFYKSEDSDYLKDEKIQNAILQQQYFGELKKIDLGIAYFKTFNYIGKTEKPVNIIIILTSDAIGIDKTKYYDENGKLFLFNSNNELIYAEEGATVKLVEAIANYSPEKNRVVVDGNKYLYMEQKYYNNRFIYAIPYSSVLKEITSQNIFVFFVILVTLTAGTLFVLFFLKQNMRPVKNILHSIGHIEGEGNEYDVIMKSISSSKQDLNDMVNKFSSLRPIIVQKMIEQMITTGQIDDVLVKKAENYLNNKFFYLILIDVANTGVLREENSDSFGDEQQLSFVAISNIFSEILESVGYVYCGHIDDNIVIIVNSSEDNHKRIIDELDKASVLSQKFLGIFTRVISSETIENMYELPTIYSYLVDCMDYARIKDYKGLIDYIPDKNTEASTDGYMKEQFVHSILYGKRKSAMKIINTVIENRTLSSKHVGKYNIADMIMCAVGSLGNKECTEIDVTVLCDKILEVIMKEKNSSVLKEKISDFICKLCDMAESIQSQQVGVVEQAAEFVRANFSQSILNVTRIADEFNITPTYLSKKFREKYDIGLLEYINQVRIEYAKHLLVTTDMNLESIMIQCGYTNKVTFLRQFKKLTGKTPAGFKEIQ